MIDLLDLHTHTTANDHACSSPYEMTRSASERSTRIFDCSDHAPAIPSTCHYYHFINFEVIPRTLYGVKLMMGIELSIMDYEGGADLGQNLLQNLGYTIVSLHHSCIKSGTMTQNTSAYLGVMKNLAVHIIGHPDDSRYLVDHGALVSAAREHETLLEVSDSSPNLMSFHQGAKGNYLKMLELCKYYRTPIIVDSDTHCEANSGDHTFTHVLLEEVSFPPELVVNTSLDLLTSYIPQLTSILAQPDDARCGQAGRDAGSTTSAGDTASAGSTASTGGTGK